MADKQEAAIKLKMMNEFKQSSHKWNTNEDIASILLSAQRHPEWLHVEPVELPPSGSQLLFCKTEPAIYKQDGYSWKKRKEGRLVREDHMKLKVKGSEILAASYVHSLLVPTFHRRAYWLINSPDIIFVHYLNVYQPSDDHNALMSPKQTFKEQLYQYLRVGATQLNMEHMVRQLQPMLFSPFSARDNHITAGELNQLVTSAYNCVGEIKTSQDIVPPLQKSVTQTDVLGTKTGHYPMERSSSCNVGVRNGINSHIMHRQPSFLSDPAEPPPVQELAAWQDVIDDVSLERQNHGRPRHTDSAYDSSSLEMFEYPVATISDYSPNWSFCEGGAKVLITGPWWSLNPPHSYYCIFDNTSVPATLIQAGVLRCYSPVHEPGDIYLKVGCNNRVISGPVLFSYKQSAEMKNRTVMKILKRLEYLDQFLEKRRESQIPMGSDVRQSRDPIETKLVCIVTKMSRLVWVQQSVTPRKFDTPLVHMVASLGFCCLIEQLYIWNTENPSELLKVEMNPHSRDSLGRTAFDWTLMNANKDTVITTLHNYCNANSAKGGNVDDFDPTQLWVYSGGNIMLPTDQFRQPSDRFEGEKHRKQPNPIVFNNGDWLQDQKFDQSQPLRVEIPMDIQIPDSPRMQEMWTAITSPYGLTDEGTMSQMADLAQTIINALPDRIKQEETLTPFDGMFQSPADSLLPGYQDTCNLEGLLTVLEPYDKLLAPCLGDDDDTTGHSPSSTKHLGAYFNAHKDDLLASTSPLDKKFRNLTLSDEEQRELYQAARVIQTAYRNYRAKIESDRETDSQRRAATVIQAYYRRYRQYCYFKRIQRAAEIIQKHFRLRRQHSGIGKKRHYMGKRKLLETDTGSECTIHLKISSDDIALEKKEMAATKIQHAYRGHMRKRQNAARKIQKFMRKSRQKMIQYHMKKEEAARQKVED